MPVGLYPFLLALGLAVFVLGTLLPSPGSSTAAKVVACVTLALAAILALPGLSA